MRVEPGLPRFRIEPFPGGTCVSIPSARNWFIVLFSILWLGIWTFGEVSTGRQILQFLSGSGLAPANRSVTFLIFWECLWTLGGVMVVSMIAWQLGGREVLRIDSGTLSLSVGVGPIGRTREFDLLQVRRLRTAPVVPSPWSRQAQWYPPIFGSGYGTVAFDYGARTYRLGSGLDEAEADALVKALAPKLPRNAV